MLWSTAYGTHFSVRRWVALAEALAVFLAVMLYIWRFRISHPTSYLVILGYVVGSHFAYGESLRRLGFGWRNARRAFPFVFVWSMVVGAGVVLAGALAGTLRPMRPGHVAAGIGAYILWGLFQQYVLNGYFVNRLLAFAGESRARLVPFAAAGLFSAAHLPNWFLVTVTFVGGYVCARVYLRYRSLYPLAVAHGMVGFFLLLVTPDSIAMRFLIGPRYFLEMYGSYPEFLLF
jgi:hypothetical protein